MKVSVKTKKWGNSLGVILPAEMVKQMNIKEGEEFTISIEKKFNVLKEAFGALDFHNVPTEKLLEKTRKELKSKWMK